MKDKLLEQARLNYLKTLDYYKSINYVPETGDIWSHNMKNIFHIYNNSTSAEEVISSVDKTFMYSINFPFELAENKETWKNEDNDVLNIRESNVLWLLSKMKSFPIIEESSFIYEKNKIKIDGKVFSANFLRTYSISNRILAFNSNINTVLELGAGVGYQARTLMMLTNCRYTIVDLPETLFFSYIHLSLCFPNKKILYVTSIEDFNNIDDFEIVFIPAGLHKGLKGNYFDLFINAASMGEMNNKSIHGWMDFIQNDITINTLFTLNRFLNTVDNDLISWRINQNECSVSYDDKWKILYWELEPEYCRCPYIDPLHARYVEIIATRPLRLLQEDKIKLSNKLLQDVKNEDWYRLQNHSTGIMTARDNVLVNDLTMSGCLFKLWESIRLNKNALNLEVISKFDLEDGIQELIAGYQLINKFKNKDFINL